MTARPHVYALTRSEGQWIVNDFATMNAEFQGPFLQAWAAAADLARHSAPAIVVALNDLGEPIVREIFDRTQVE